MAPVSRIERLFVAAADASKPPTSSLAVHQLVLIGVVGTCLYGATMGSFGLIEDWRWLQVVYSSLKVPVLLGTTFLLCLPTYFVINTLMGLRSDFADAVRALATTQAGLAVLLASLSPYTILWYCSFSGYAAAVLFNGVLFAIASLSAQILLRREYGRLIARDRRHQRLLIVWLFLYVFVGIQVAWILRPFIGTPGMPAQFFRADTWGNAYVKVFELLFTRR